VSLERRAQFFQVIDRQVEIGDAETADGHWLAQVQADTAVGTPTEGQVAGPVARTTGCGCSMPAHAGSIAAMEPHYARQTNSTA